MRLEMQTRRAYAQCHPHHIAHHNGGFAAVLGPVWACTLAIFAAFLPFGRKQQQPLNKSQRSKTCQTNN